MGYGLWFIVYSLELKKSYIIIKGLMLLAVVVLAVGCSDDSGDSDERTDSGLSTSITLVPYASSYTEVEPLVGGTRAGWIPTGYKLYSDLTGIGDLVSSNEGASIGVFFTHGTTAEELRRFGKSTGDWKIYKDAIEPGNYYLYGYVPYGAGTASITYRGASYEDGAVLSLRGVNGVLNQDLCVIVGAKEGSSATAFNEGRVLKPGDFDCHIKPNDNYVFLLFDHLCSALRFRFQVDDVYAKLRTIKVTKLELSAYSNKACTTPAKQLDATITLQKTTDDVTPPIVGDVVFTPSNSGGDTYKVKIYEYEGNDGGDTLPSVYGEYTDYLGFAPVTNTLNYYMLYSTYDVYDKKGNLIRKNCVATNKIDIGEHFVSGLQRSHIYTLNLKVVPTYLYMLSEPDLDNPTVEVSL